MGEVTVMSGAITFESMDRLLNDVWNYGGTPDWCFAGMPMIFYMWLQKKRTAGYVPPYFVYADGFRGIPNGR